MDIVAYQTQYTDSLVGKPENLNQTAVVREDGMVMINIATKDVGELASLRDWLAGLLSVT